MEIKLEIKDFHDKLTSISHKYQNVLNNFLLNFLVEFRKVNTVKPLYSGYPSDFPKASTIGRCPL